MRRAWVDRQDGVTPRPGGVERGRELGAGRQREGDEATPGPGWHAYDGKGRSGLHRVEEADMRRAG
jgi:hypothetical protein